MEIPKDWIEAGARAAYESTRGFAGAWDKATTYAKEHYTREATACLAAVFGRAEVVFTSKYDGHDVECDCGVGAPGFTLNAGDTLVIVRGA